MDDIGPVLYCGDPHSKFDHIVEAAAQTKASAVVLLGDLEPRRPLHEELAALIELGVPVWYIHGNHDADSDALWERMWGSELADRNLHGRVVTLPNGQRLAGLGGVFRKSVWYPSSSAAQRGAPAFRSMSEHASSTPRQDRWGGSGPPRRHWGTIYPETVDHLAKQEANVLITHEAPGYHPHGFELLDTLAQAMGVKVMVHGHHHDRLDSSGRWTRQGFKSFGIGLRGITAMNTEGKAEVIVPGELDDARDSRKRCLDPFGKDEP